MTRFPPNMTGFILNMAFYVFSLNLECVLKCRNNSEDLLALVFLTSFPGMFQDHQRVSIII